MENRLPLIRFAMARKVGQSIPFSSQTSHTVRSPNPKGTLNRLSTNNSWLLSSTKSRTLSVAKYFIDDFIIIVPLFLNHTTKLL